MKYLFIVIALVSCTAGKPTVDLPNAFDWLLGNWERTNEEAGKLTFEKWTKQSDSVYIGLSYTLKGTDTVWKEDVVLKKQAKVWFYTVFQKGQTDSTSFRLTEIGANSFVCENKQNEFPKKITYLLDGEMIRASVSDDKVRIPFDFRKVRSTN